jgi:sec-independent protein translocase protein TatA
MFGLGTQELIIILAIGGLLFGAKKLPELGRGLGEAIRGFKKSVAETEEKILTDQNASAKSTDSPKSTEE